MIAGLTGRADFRHCEKCLAVVLHREGFYLGAPENHWSADGHRAPCGRWCLGGGIQRREFASLREAYREAHGTLRGCLSCGPATSSLAASGASDSARGDGENNGGQR
jgi:hypothetical protein